MQRMSDNGERILYLDNLKAFLIALVVLHHFGMGFTNQFWWIFQVDKNFVTAGRLMDFGDAFAMGLFFFVSGYLFPAAFDRNGLRSFLLSRVVRLGLVFLLVLFTVNLLVMYLHHTFARDFPPVSLWTYFTDYFMGGAPSSWTWDYIGPNPKPNNWPGPYWPDYLPLHLWFIQNLLIFALAYALLRVTLGTLVPLWKAAPPATPLRFVPVLMGTVVFVSLVTALSYWVRLDYPIDKYDDVLHHIMTEWAHMPAYVLMVTVGVVAYRRNWLDRLPESIGWFWFAVGLAALAANLLGWVYQDLPGAPHKGGPTTHAAIYALWESVVGVGWAFGLLVLFRRVANSAQRVWRFAVTHCYTVYLIHLPVIFGMTMLAEWLNPRLVLFTYLIGFASVLLSFGAAALLHGTARSIVRFFRGRRAIASAT